MPLERPSMRGLVYCSVALAAASASVTAPADEAASSADTPIAYRGVRLYTVAGAPVDKGILVVHKGKILAVGPVDEVRIPDQATIRDMSGKTIIPGLVDTHSHIGIYPRPHAPAHAAGK